MILSAVFLVGMAVGLARHGLPEESRTAASSGPTIDKLEALEELVIQKVSIADILSYSDGSRTAVWLIRGDGLISVPLSGAQISQRQETRKTATILLPRPQVLSARVDHERTRFWDAKQGFWSRMNPWAKSLHELQIPAMREAQRRITEAVGSPEHLSQAEKVASSLIQNLYSELGWTITIEWISHGDPP